MTQQEKQILLKDLCARIPYRTFVQQQKKRLIEHLLTDLPEYA